MHKAVFLDRDGVITQEPPYYAHKIKDLRLISNVGLAINRLNKAGFKIIIVTNQAGIAKGYFKEEDTQIFNQELIKRLKKQNAKIDGIFYCPHHLESNIDKYKLNCDCRKPKIGLVKKATEKFNLDTSNCFFIGDKKSDIDTGTNAGLKTILVLTGQGKEELKKTTINPTYLAKNLLEASSIILKL